MSMTRVRSLPAPEFVFGYGSLSAEVPDAVEATMLGCVRVWDVAMDNAETIPGYKYYVDPVSAARPPVCVTFLNLADAVGVDCAGVLIPVRSAGLLEALDRRERNYARVEVSDRILAALPAGARVWTYLGTRAARQRYACAVAAGRAVVARAYKESVEAGFRARGLGAGYRASTRRPECRVVDLLRREVSADVGSERAVAG